MSAVNARTTQSLRAVGALVAFAFIGCTSAAAQPVPESAAGVSASQVHCADPAPLTAAIAEEFALSSLRAYLEQPNVVTGQFGAGDIAQTATPAEQSAPLELRFDVGEFSYYEKIAGADAGCDDTIHAPAHITVRIGNQLLSFEADGVLWKGRNEPSAHFYADADLAIATGSYDPQLDTSRIHAGQIEILLYPSPGHLRGNITAEAVYFDNEAQRVRYRRGRSSDFADLSVLFRLSFPNDRCADNEVPFATDEPIEMLGGQTAHALRASVARRIGEQTAADAVWKNGDETRVTVELGEPARGGTACLAAARFTGDRTAPAARWALGMRLEGRLTTADGRIEIPLTQLVLSVDDDGVPRAWLRAWVFQDELSARARQALERDPDVLEAVVTYDFAQDGDARFGGIVRLHRQIVDNTFVPLDCVAFPAGGMQDLGDCRHRPSR